MPLPMPRSVTSSPIHMITAVPATIVIIMVAMVSTEGSGISGWLTAEQAVPENRSPERASSTYPAEMMTASITVRYQLHDGAGGEVGQDVQRGEGHVQARS